MNYQIVMCLLFTLQIATQADLLLARKEVNGQILYSCDFENDTCQMTAEAATSGFTWLRISGSTPSETTGPDFDHTTSTPNGYYMYTEASEFQPGEIAKLRLPSLGREPKGAICVTFWYHLYGQHIGTLNVSQNDSVLSSISFNQSYNWFQQNVTIKLPSAGSIYFVGVRGGFAIGQPYGDIAIDDVVIYDEPCEYEITTEEETTTTPPPTTTTTTTATTTTTEFTTTLFTTTKAIASTNMPLLQTNSSRMLTTQTVANITQSAAATTQAAVTSSQINQTNDLTANVTKDFIGQSQSSSRTLEAMMMSTGSNATTIGSQMNSTGVNNLTVGTQSSGTFSTGNNFMTTTTKPNSTLYNFNVSKVASPAAVEMTVTNSTVSTIKTDSMSDNKTATNTTDSSSAPKYDSLQSTTAMLIDSQASSSKKIWNLTEQNLILLLAFLGAFILILILVVSVLACCLCVTRRRYNVARSANVYNSNTTLDRNSLNENQRVTTIKSDHEYM